MFLLRWMIHPPNGAMGNLSPCWCPGAIRWDAGDTNLLHGQVSDWVFRGEFHRLEFHLDSGLTFQFQSTNLPPGGKLQTGTPLTIRLAAEGILCLPDGEQASHG